MMDYVDFMTDDQATKPQPDRGWIGWGYYEEAYVRTGETWLISYVRLTRQSMDFLTTDQPAPEFGGYVPSKDWLWRIQERYPSLTLLGRSRHRWNRSTSAET
jgi:hypothetical protein